MMKKFTRFMLALCLCLIWQSSLFAQAVFTDNYAAGVTFEAFGGSTNAVSVDMTEKNAGTSSLKVVVPAAGYTGGALKAATTQNLTAYNALTFWAKASAAKSLNVSGIGNNGTTNTYQTEWNAVALTTTWKKYIIPIPNAAKLTAEDGLFHFAEGSDEGAYTIWFDDIQYENLTAGVIGAFVPAIATEMINVLVGANFPINGASVTVPVNAVNQTLAIGAANFTFTSSNAAVATVSATGQGTALATGTTTITAKLGTINAAGALTVNVTAASNPTASAPTPTPAAANVISLFSNAYTNVPVDTWSASWDNADVADFIIGTNDTTKKYTNLVFAGVEFTTKPVDASTMTHFHIDVWSPNATEFKIKLVDFGANKAFGGGDDSEHELTYNATSTPALSTNKWISFDIPLSSFTGLKAKGALAQMIFVSSTATVFVDNVYFYKGASAPASPTASAPTPTPAAANVISLFSNAYTNVPVDTWSASWDNADVADFIIGTNDTTKKYTNLVFAGVEFTTKPVDASTMTHFHIDVWSPNATEFKIKLVDFGANKAFGGGDDSEHELTYNATSTPAIATGKWISFDIPLSSFTGLKAKGALAQMIFVSSNATVFVDNVYFYKTAVAPTSPTASAPTPTPAAANVISLFSNAYTNVPVDTWSASWDQADVENFVIGTNDTTKKYTNLVFAGVEFTTKPVDASTMTHFHIDIWSPNATEFKIKLVDFGANKAFGGGDDSEHELTFNATSTPAIATGKWISFDIPLSSFTGLKAKGALAQMIFVSSNATVFVDNVYFYKTVVAPTSPTASAPTPTRSAANVISLFSNAYTNVPVDTWSASWDQADVENFVIGTNDTTKKYSNLVFAGVEFTTKPIDASTMTHFHIDIWSPNATEFKIKLVDFGANKAFGGGDDSEHELTYNATSTPAIATGKWISFDIPLSSFTGLKAKAALAQMIFVSSNATVFVDNVYLYKTSTGTNDIRFVQNLFKAYPSVSDEFLTVELTSAPLNKIKTLSIMNPTGTSVFTQILNNEQTTIPVKSLPNGLYIMAVRVGEVMQTQKIIIQH